MNVSIYLSIYLSLRAMTIMMLQASSPLPLLPLLYSYCALLRQVNVGLLCPRTMQTDIYSHFDIYETPTSICHTSL